MARRVSNFKLGLFVVAGLVVGSLGLVWVGATSYFQQAATYVTYFDDSVQGLLKDSSVKYRGVDIGRVQSIHVAPDGRLIEVVMKLDFPGDLKDVVAELKMVGITGIVFVELDRRTPNEPDRSPQLSFTPPYPVIPSRPSNVAQILAGVGELMSEVGKIDFPALAHQFAETAAALKETLGGESMRHTLASMEGVAGHLDHVSLELDRLMADGKLEDVLVEARRTLVEARGTIQHLDEEMKALDLASTGGEVRRAAMNVEQMTQATRGDIQALSGSLQRASEKLETLLDRLNADPSVLLFGSPPPRRRP